MIEKEISVLGLTGYLQQSDLDGSMLANPTHCTFSFRCQVIVRSQPVPGRTEAQLRIFGRALKRPSECEKYQDIVEPTRSL